MFVSSGANEIHHIRVKEIYELNPFDGEERIKIVGTTRIKILNPKKARGYELSSYEVDIIAKGFLVNYITAEIDVGDSLCVVGYTTTRKVPRGNAWIPIREVVATCVYKEDFLKYFPRNTVEELD